MITSLILRKKSFNNHTSRIDRLMHSYHFSFWISWITIAIYHVDHNLLNWGVIYIYMLYLCPGDWDHQEEARPLLSLRRHTDSPGIYLKIYLTLFYIELYMVVACYSHIPSLIIFILIYRHYGRILVSVNLWKKILKILESYGFESHQSSVVRKSGSLPSYLLIETLIYTMRHAWIYIKFEIINIIIILNI